MIVEYPDYQLLLYTALVRNRHTLIPRWCGTAILR
jgi:hypothetical protein